MKTVGSHWIADVPSGWRIDTPRFAFSVRGERAKPGMEQMTASQQYGVIPQSEYVKKTGSHVVVVEKDFTILKAVYPGDFVIHMRSFQGGLELSEVKGCTSSAYVMLIPGPQIHSARYYRWVFKCDGYINELRSTSNLVRDGQAMRWANFIQVPIPFPPPEVQDSIAKYLDRETERIEELKDSIRAQIDALEAYKRSVIFDAVTTGLDPNRDMVDSKIDWIDRLPRNWNVAPLRYFFHEHKAKNLFGQETNLLSLSYGRIIRKDIGTVDGLLPSNFNGYNIVGPGDIVLRLTDLQNDQKSLRTGLVNERGIVTSAYIALRKHRELDSTYFHYLFHTYDICRVFYNMGSGVRQGLTFSELSRLPLVAPPLDEQRRIGRFLNEEITKIDEVQRKKRKQLDLLEAYKKSLIYEVVTGKREVPVQ